MEKRVNTYYSVRQRKHITIDPSQQTTGELIVEDLGISEVPNLAQAIDIALQKELEYGIHLGKKMKPTPDYRSLGEIKKDDKKLHVKKPPANDRKRVRSNRKKV